MVFPLLVVDFKKECKCTPFLIQNNGAKAAIIPLKTLVIAETLQSSSDIFILSFKVIYVLNIALLIWSTIKIISEIIYTFFDI